MTDAQVSIRPAELLALAASNTRWSRLAADVRQQACDVLVDVIAVIAYGSTDPEIRRLRTALIACDGNSTVIGHPSTAAASTAALLNGAATTVHQLQDGHRLARGHPGSHVIPAVLAVAEEQRAEIEAMLSAFVAGYEVAVRVGMALGGVQPALHDTGTWGTIGAAVAAAHILSRGDPALIAAAIEGSAAVALFPYRETAGAGASIHHLYTGLGSSIGVTSAYGVIGGMSTLPGSLELFFGPRAGAAFNQSTLISGVDKDRKQWVGFEILNSYFKIHPTCAHMHCVNDVVDALLVGERTIAVADVKRVDVWTYAQATEFADQHPGNALAARFSIPFTVAAAIRDGALRLESFSADELRDPRLTELCDRVFVHHDPTLDAGYPAGRPARVIIELRDGSRVAGEAQNPKGDVTNPITRKERRSKAHRLLKPVYGETGADDVIRSVESVCEGAPLTALTSALKTTRM